MENLRILLCCGAGMSSGFLASNARKAAKKNKIAASIEARSFSEANEYMGSIDVLLLGPHYANYKHVCIIKRKCVSPHCMLCII